MRCDRVPIIPLAPATEPLCDPGLAIFARQRSLRSGAQEWARLEAGRVFGTWGHRRFRMRCSVSICESSRDESHTVNPCCSRL